MRHAERKIKNRETLIALLERVLVGRIATVNRKGFPVIKPVNFLYWNGKIYIHSSMKGEKVSDIRRGSPVCFEVDQPVAYVAAKGSACHANFYYRSLLVKGTAGLVKDTDKKLKILERMMAKYQPEGGYEPMADEVLRKTAVIELTVQKMTGKERLG